jgi:mono/diheme cytochrome c family protein
LLCVWASAASIAVGAAESDGYFTREQALRGKTLFLAQCATCHADNLQGIGSAPPLAGGAFLAKWSTSNVRDLYDRLRTTMPQNAPGSLSNASYADLTAYVLRSNNFPTGIAELQSNGEALQKLPLTGGRP